MHIGQFGEDFPGFEAHRAVVVARDDDGSGAGPR